MMLKIKSAIRDLLKENSYLLFVYTAVFFAIPAFSGWVQSLFFVAWLGLSFIFIGSRFSSKGFLYSFLITFFGSFVSFALLSLAFLSLRSLNLVTAWISLLPVFTYSFYRITKITDWSFLFGRDLLARHFHPFILVFLSSAACLLLFLGIARNAEPLVSPWFLMPSISFILYGINCYILIARRDDFTLPTWFVLTALHVFVSVAVSSFIYGIGFGFDPFIHRAAQDFIVRNGYIDPLQFFYMGQYAFISSLHFVSGVSVRILDIWYVPLLSSLLVPICSYFGLYRGWGSSESIARLGWIAALIVPYSLLTFSVPFTFTYLQFLLLIMIFPLFFTQDLVFRVAALSFLVAGLSFHPLLLLPALILLFPAIFPRLSKVNGVTLFLLLVFSCSLVLPLAFFVYQYSSGISVSLGSLLNYTEFTSLFVNIFGGWDSRVIPLLNAAYIIRYWLPIVVLIFGSIGVYLSNFKYKRFFFGFLLVLALNIYALSTLFYFEGIIPHEQKEFALRLLQAIYAAGGVGAILLFERIRQAWFRQAIFIGLSLLLVLSWYFSYPQYNAKFAFTSPSVSRYDIEGVRAIDLYSDQSSYIVLSNQMMAAAALQEFGFDQYVYLNGEQVLRYPIPTGGPLYEYYLRSLFRGDLSALDELHDKTSVDYIFLVHHGYWPISPTYSGLLEDSSFDRLIIDNKITIYIFSYGS